MCSSIAPDGAKVLDNLMLVSHSFFDKANTRLNEIYDFPQKKGLGDGDLEPNTTNAIKEEPIGGHADAIIFDGDAVWKRGPSGSKGLAELSFLKLALDQPDISQFVPRLVGVHFKGDEMWLGMENALYGFRKSAVMDVKIGTRTHPPDACPQRAEKRKKMALETTSSTLGFRVVGAKFLGPDAMFRKVGYKHNINIDSVLDVKDLFSQFFCTDMLVRSAIHGIDEITGWMKSQSWFAFYSSSLLFAYDAQDTDKAVVRFIDFANMSFIQRKEEDLSGFLFGLTTLRSILVEIIS